MGKPWRTSDCEASACGFVTLNGAQVAPVCLLQQHIKPGIVNETRRDVLHSCDPSASQESKRIGVCRSFRIVWRPSHLELLGGLKVSSSMRDSRWLLSRVRAR